MSLPRWGYRCFLRLAIFVGLLSAVVTVIYLTPVPDLEHVSCIRPCHELDWPMICRFRFIFERHQTMGPWCGDCPKNISDCFRPNCVIADGNTARLITVNRQLPGQSLQVCENDIVVVEVENRVAGSSLAVHWAGQPQVGSPYMDGVPMVTQCPVAPYTTFQYKFRAHQHGTHFWKTHTGNELLDNAYGAVVVRRPASSELLRDSYDADRPQHAMVISQWSSPLGSSILINGVASIKEELVWRAHVEAGQRYRMRVAFSHGASGCPVLLSVAGHTMLVVALDGHYISPRNTSAVLIAPGERLDFILKANQQQGVYSISAESNCTLLDGLAKLEYNVTRHQDPGRTEEAPPRHQNLLKVLSTVTRGMCESPGVLCLQHIESRKKMPSHLESVDQKLYLPFDLISISGLEEPRMDNISFMFPPAPLASQPQDSHTAPLLCNSHRAPRHCAHNNPVCVCTHVIDLPLDSTVEILLVDQGSESKEEKVFHLHGYSFYVAGVASGLRSLTPDQIKERHRRGSLFPGMSERPVRKDTVAIPAGGAVALRFKASNPGYWSLHEQSSALWSEGMNVILRVGEPSDLPPVPEDFPACGNWVGPEFFLI